MSTPIVRAISSVADKRLIARERPAVRLRPLVVAALDHQFGSGKELVVSCLVRVEVRANQIVDLVGLRSNGGKPVHDIICRAHFELEVQRFSRTRWVVVETVRVSAIDRMFLPSSLRMRYPSTDTPGACGYLSRSTSTHEKRSRRKWTYEKSTGTPSSAPPHLLRSGCIGAHKRSKCRLCSTKVWGLIPATVAAFARQKSPTVSAINSQRAWLASKLFV